MGKCLICDKPTKHQYSIPNDDVKFSYCKRHEFYVTTYVIQLRTDDKFNAEQWLKRIRANESEGNKTGVPKKRK